MIHSFCVVQFLKSLLAKQPCERLIVSPRRQIVLEGPLMVHDSGKPVEMYVFLFDDLLLISRRKKGLGKKVCSFDCLFIQLFSSSTTELHNKTFAFLLAINADRAFRFQLQRSQLQLQFGGQRRGRGGPGSGDGHRLSVDHQLGGQLCSGECRQCDDHCGRRGSGRHRR